MNVSLCQEYPSELEDLTLTEEYVIARSHPIGTILKLRPNGLPCPVAYNAIRGHLVTIPQDPGPLLDILPSADLRFHDHIGVVWSGNPDHKSDRRRSIPAATVLPSLIMPGVRLFGLQKDARPEDADALKTMAADVIDLSPALDDFTDTAAALQALDLVIAVDTSTAHLAGALGRPAWLMLPFALDWRWLRDREDSPWYPTMRLFRQSTPRVWTDVLGRIRSELSRLTQDGRDCPTRVSARRALRRG